MAIAFFFFGRQIVGLYSDDPAVISQRCGDFGSWLLLFSLSNQLNLFLAGALRGAGDTRATAIITLLTVLFVRPGLALYFVHIGLGLKGAWYALVVDQLLRSLLVMRYRSGKWQSIRV